MPRPQISELGASLAYSFKGRINTALFCSFVDFCKLVSSLAFGPRVKGTNAKCNLLIVLLYFTIKFDHEI